MPDVLANEDKRHAPEIVVAFVAAAGSDRDQIILTFERLLRQFDYDSRVVRISSMLERTVTTAIPTSARDRAWLLQTEGNRLCELAERSDALAFLAVEGISEARLEAHRAAGREANVLDVAPGNAYLLWSLKRPDEVMTLRAIYRTRIFVVSVHTPLRDRIDRIAQGQADLAGHLALDTADQDAALALIERDDAEAKGSEAEYGQNVSDTYPLADFIVDASSPESLDATASRSLNIIFGDPFATPTRSEFGMFVAHAGALKSAELGRQVGAALLTDAGEVLAVGTNEIPRPGGGHFWHGDPNDDREFVRGFDTSDRLRQRLISEIVEAIVDVAPDEIVLDRPNLAKALESTRLQDLIEYGRAVHAEMAAMLDAARLGIQIKGSIASVTTFPCHWCSRMLIAAGVSRVEYIYPYPKSLATEIYRRTIRTTPAGSLDTVPFLPFIGVAPRRYAVAFSAPKHRKHKTGAAVDRHAQSPRLLREDEIGEWDLSTHLVRERHALEIAATFGTAQEELNQERTNT